LSRHFCDVSPVTIKKKSCILGRGSRQICLRTLLRHGGALKKVVLMLVKLNHVILRRSNRGLNSALRRLSIFQSRILFGSRGGSAKELAPIVRQIECAARPSV